MTIDEAIRQVREVYRDLEEIDEPRDCVDRTDCCHFRLTGKTPVLTTGEALVAAKGVRATGKKALTESLDPKRGKCPLLGVAGKCTIYDSRPFGCRTHFCTAAGGPFSRASVRELIHRLEEIAESLGDTDPRPIEAAVSAALDTLEKQKRRRR